ncbi:MAG: hypothetical protein EOO40_08880 [Deltaproteobacteria bacterium]|nr:MAG: hypothetical protein EOO40_08880 [Deltaproteobacteria bacterium]
MQHSIPRHLHHIWWSWDKGGIFFPTDTGPPTAGHATAWQRLHPDYAYTLWRRAASFDFVAAYYPQRHAQFTHYEWHIQRCDMFRLLVLHHMGGIYGDIDLVPAAHLDGLWQRHPNAGLILATETELTAERVAATAAYPVRQGIAEHPLRLANYWLAARPGHPLLQQMLDLMQSRAHLPVKTKYDILYTTGPDVVTTAVHAHAQHYDDVVILPMAEADRYFVHERAGSWRF